MIIDAHAHTFPDKIAEKALHRLAIISGITPATNGTVSGTISYMKSLNIDKFINLNIATSPSQQITINNTAAENNKKYHAMISTGSVHPDNPDALNELQRIKDLSIKAIKLHPDYQGFFIDEEKQAIGFNVIKYSSRSIEEPPTSMVIKGPREGFNESIKTNISLIDYVLKYLMSLMNHYMSILLFCHLV